jgi:hypothetical protein
MKMKNLIKNSILVLMLLSVIPMQMKANTEVAKIENKEAKLEAKILTDRLVEIKAMDKSTMTRTEKKALRKEVKSINTNLADLNGGVYLTTGAIIIIILLLILIL